MTEKKIYKKDKAVIKEITGKVSRVVGMCYMMFGLFMAVLTCIINIFEGTEEIFMSFGVMTFFWLAFIGIIFRINGTSVMGNADNIDKSREAVKGAPSQIFTFICLPVRKQSVYRYQFEQIMLCVMSFTVFVFVYMIFYIVSGSALDIVTALVSLFVYLIITVLTLSIYTPVFKNTKSKKIITSFVNTFMVVASIGLAVLVYANIFGMLDLGFGKLTAVSLGAGAPWFFIAFAAIYPIAVYIFYKKFVMTREGGGWFE